jgi:nitroreductase
LQDATIFGAYLQLAIVNAGLASVWVGAFKKDRIRKLLKIPENLKPIAVISLGYPVGEKSERRRRNYKEIIL